MNSQKTIKKFSINDIADQIGIFPTDTLYGIVGSAFSKKAVKRIYAIKGRDENKPFIILISSLADLKKFGIALSPEQKIFLHKTWSERRPTSVILPVPLKKFEYLHRGTKSLAFRLPANRSQAGKPQNKELLAIIKKVGPLVAPSANPQGAAPAETIAEAKNYFGDCVDFYIAGGRKAGKPSKLISLLDSEPKILRE